MTVARKLTLEEEDSVRNMVSTGLLAVFSLFLPSWVRQRDGHYTTGKSRTPLKFGLIVFPYSCSSQ